VSVHTSAGLRRPISVGVLAGLVVLASQPTVGLPALRVGVVPLIASACGTVVAIASLLVREDASGRFAETWDELARGEQR